MKPVPTSETNVVFKLPGGTEENDLPAARLQTEGGAAVLRSTWELTPEERAAIAVGGALDLTVWGTAHPAVALEVVPAEAPEHGEKEWTRLVIAAAVLGQAWAQLDRALRAYASGQVSSSDNERSV